LEKNLCDGVVGTVKHAAACASLQAATTGFLLTPADLCSSGARSTSQPSQASNLSGRARKKLQYVARHSVEDSSNHGKFRDEKTMLLSPVQMDGRLAEFLELKLTMCAAAVTALGEVNFG